jgi:2-C-methyl-D-erythritol 2,4-cyclodiphosphate synthase
MREKISAALGINPWQINIKATTNERMGFIGRKEGIAALAVAAVDIDI